MSKRKNQVRTALKGLAEAKSLRATAKELESSPCNDRLGASFMRMDADKLEHEAMKDIEIKEESVQKGVGGELTLGKEQELELPGLVNTVDNPDSVTAEASQDRLKLTLDIDCAEMAMDTAETIQAKNSLEKMLAHQLASAHKLAMEFAKKALEFTKKAEDYPKNEMKDFAMEGARAAGTSAKLMDVYQKGMQTLFKIRSGGQQTVTVQHVNVTDGGQAVVAGGLKTGGDIEKGQ